MNVVLVVSGFPDSSRPSYGIFNRRVAGELSGRVDLTVIAPRAWKPGRRRWEEEDYEGIHVIRVAAPMLPGFPRLNLRLFHAGLQRPMQRHLRRADVVHSVGVEFTGLWVGSMARQRSFRHVTQVINDLRRLKNADFGTYPYLGALRRNLDGILCNSRSLEATARQYFPEVPLVRTAYRGADLALFSPEGERAPIFPGGEGCRFLFLGGIPAYPDRIFGRNTKGGLTLMEAWSRAEDDLARSGAALVFGGPDSQSPQALAWRNSLKHPQNVRLGGMTSPSEVPAVLRSADVVLVPSLEEGCPNVAFEAFSSGRAVVGSDIPPVAELVGDGECGFTVPAGDAGAWRDVLVRLADPAARAGIRSLGAAARNRAERRFDQRNYAKKLVEIYGEIATLSR